MRKHPLIALTAFTALGASAIAGTTTGSFNSVLTSAKSTGHPHQRISPVSLKPTLKGGRDLVAVHDLGLRDRADLSSATGLPPAHHRHVRKHVKKVVVIAIPAPVPAPAPAPPPAPVTTTTAPAPPPPPAAPAGGSWYELRTCESGDNYAENTGNGYYGAYQFSLSTWYGLGYSGLPSEASPAVQDQAAAELQARSGWGQWPQCAAELGLT